MPLFGQLVVSSCLAPDSIVKKYKKSADKLTVRRVEYIGNTYKDSIIINKQISNQYLNALIAVYNATALAARDTVVVIPIVLDFYNPPDLNTLYIGADSTKIWTKNLRNNILPCGNTGIDDLITKYYLRKTGYSDFSNTKPYHLISFETDSNCYINRLCDKFNSFYQQGVLITGPNSMGGNTSLNITDSINPNFIELTYSAGWGDCMVGCIYRRFWKFRVYNNCIVEYKGSYGDALPFNPLLDIHKEQVNASEFIVFPNPITEKFQLKTTSGSPLNISLTINNNLGQIVFEKEVQTNQEIDLSALPNGIYYFKVNRENQFKVIKVMKE